MIVVVPVLLELFTTVICIFDFALAGVSGHTQRLSMYYNSIYYSNIILLVYCTIVEL